MSMARRQKTFDFNSLLRIANLVVAAMIVACLDAVQGNEYVDRESVWLGILLCVQTHGALVLERRRRDPFVLLLAFEMIFYYSTRIVTLTAYPFSGVFFRYGFEPGDMDYALIFILLANLCLYGGLYMARGEPQPVGNEGWRPTSAASVVTLIIAAILFDYFGSTYFTEGTLPRALNFLVLFLTPTIVSLMTFAYFAVYRRSLTRKFALAIGLLIALEIVLHTLFGSRSALVGFIQNLVLVALAVNVSIRIPRRWVIAGFLSLPLLMVVLVASFAISTFNRANREMGGSLNLGHALLTASESASTLEDGPNLEVLLPPIFARAGFLDFSAEIIAHRDVYSTVMNPTVYGESIVDNVLTPGFDVFDQPLISQSLQFLYLDQGKPSKVGMLDNYQSDQIGVYGDFYTLFGWGALPVLFLVTYGLKRLYLWLHDANPFRLATKRVIVLFVFILIIRSFGLDWMIVETLPLIVAMYLYSAFFSATRIRSQAVLGGDAGRLA